MNSSRTLFLNRQQVIEETPEIVEICQVCTETGEISKVTKSKKVIRLQKNLIYEVIAITILPKTDEKPLITVSVVKRELLPKNSKRQSVGAGSRKSQTHSEESSSYA